MNNKKLVESITARDVDFARWYTDVCTKAELMDYSEAQGFIIYRPYGYGIWESIQKYLDQAIKKTGHENVYMPLVIPQSLFEKEKDHIEGFAPEVATITTTGKEDLSEHLIVRPTSEVLFATHYAKTIQSHRDLPKLYNQWCSVVRWEKTTRPFLRGREFLWQEGHTVHSTAKEAKKETLLMLKTYEKMGKDLLAIPLVTGRKTEREKFAGALETYTIEALMYDGQALQSGTTHYFGQEFAKAFDIKFTNKENQLEYAYQTSWGVSTRLIGAVIMVHGDDEGLVLPPYVAPIQIVIIPAVMKDEKTLNYAKKLYNKLSKKYRVKLDLSDKSAGWKYAEYEMKGVPLRIEIGPRDLQNDEVTLVTRLDRQKELIKLTDIEKIIKPKLAQIHEAMYQKALDHVTKNTRYAKTYEEFKQYLAMGGYVALSISGEEAEVKIKQDTTATARAIPFKQELLTPMCPVTNKPARKTVLFARAY